MLWRCDGCGGERECDPLAGDDWGGEPVPIGPDCPECDIIPMDYVEGD